MLGLGDALSRVIGSQESPTSLFRAAHIFVCASEPVVKGDELGATRVADREEYGYTWTLMADPEGNEFDLAKAL